MAIADDVRGMRRDAERAFAAPTRRGTIIHALRRWPILPAIIIVTLVIFAIFAPQISPHDPLLNSLRERNDEPFWMSGSSGKYLLGGDPLGRDVLSRIIHGARISLMVAGIAIAAGLLIGTTLGLIAGFVGGLIDEVIMRILDINAAVPFILLALIVVIVLGQSLTTLIIVLALSNWGRTRAAGEGAGVPIEDAGLRRPVACVRGFRCPHHLQAHPAGGPKHDHRGGHP